MSYYTHTQLFDLLLSVEEEREEEAKRRKEWEPSSAEGDRDGEKETDKEENLSDDKQADGSGKKGKNSKALCDNICSLLDIKRLANNYKHPLITIQVFKCNRSLCCSPQHELYSVCMCMACVFEREIDEKERERERERMRERERESVYVCVCKNSLFLCLPPLPFQ